MKFQSIDSLLEKIEEDKNTNIPTAVRYPVRWVFLNNYKELEILKEYFKKEGVKKFSFENKIPKDDGWLTSNDIINEIKNINETVVVYSMSELLRFFKIDEFSSICRVLSEIETNNFIRIYIPLVGLWEDFYNKFFSNFHRKIFFENIIWVLSGETDSIKIFQINFDINLKEEDILFYLKNLVFIKNTKKWLNLYEISPLQKNIVSQSKTLGYLAKKFLPDSLFELVVIGNYKDFIEKLFGITIEIEINEDDELYFKKVIERAIKERIDFKKFEDIFKEFFNIKSIKNLKQREVLNLYFNQKEPYLRWMIKKIYRRKNDYLRFAFEKLEELTDKALIETLWKLSFDYKDKLEENYLNQRRDLLLYIRDELKKEIKLSRDLKKRLKELDGLSFEKAVNFISLYSKEEREYLIKRLVEDKDIEKTEERVEKIKNLQPELYYYVMGWKKYEFTDCEEWVYDYFYYYNLSKIFNIKLEELENILNKKNKDIETFSEWYSKIKEVEPIQSKNEKIIWVDALGFEWAPLIKHILERSNKDYSISVKLRKVKLPTSTQCNKYETIEKIDTLDKYIHQQNPYKHPLSLIEEIEIVSRIINEILENNNNVKIISDHGFTFLSQKKFGIIKVLDIENTSHEGRYLLVDDKNKYTNDNYYIKWHSMSGHCKGNYFLVALKHNSLDNIPYREVHGGATPEEILVPQIEINKNKVSIDSYSIIPSEIEVNNFENLENIRIKIKPLPNKTVKAKLHGKNLKIEKKEDNFIIYLGKMKTEILEVSLDIFIGELNYKIKIKRKKGFEEEDQF